MLLTGIPPLQAPQTTGHPATLPSAVPRDTADYRVQAADKGGQSTDTRTNYNRPGDSNPRAKSPPDKDSSGAAPPTILQLKIDTMLREQAESRKVDAPEAKEDRARVAEARAETETVGKPVEKPTAEPAKSDQQARKPDPAPEREPPKEQAQPQPVIPQPAALTAGPRSPEDLS